MGLSLLPPFSDKIVKNKRKGCEKKSGGQVEYREAHILAIKDRSQNNLSTADNIKLLKVA